MDMTKLAEKIDKVLEEHGDSLSVHDFAQAVAEVLVDSYGTHNIEAFKLALRVSIAVFKELQETN
jgi:hypothetical protein